MACVLQLFPWRDDIALDKERTSPMMDNLKNKASEMMGGGLDDQLKDINFPASKDELVSQLEQKGVPSQILDKVRGSSTSQFNNVDDVKKQVGM
jgi:hypothetical protein